MMNDTLFVKEKKDNNVNDILCRILTYAEKFVETNHYMPSFVKLSNRDLQMIKDYNSTLIDNQNRILHMEIVTYNPVAEYRKYLRKMNNKYHDKKIHSRI